MTNPTTQQPARPAPPPRKTMSGRATFGVVCAVTIPFGVIWLAIMLYMSPGTTRPSATASTAAPTTTSVPTSTAVKPTPAGPATSFGDGTWLAGRDFQPGTYRSAGSTVQNGYCIWERDQHPGGEGPIASDTSQGPSEVTINAGEYFVSSYCQTWTRVA